MYEGADLGLSLLHHIRLSGRLLGTSIKRGYILFKSTLHHSSNSRPSNH